MKQRLTTKQTRYPFIETQQLIKNDIRRWSFFCLIGALGICGIVNLCLGGRPWVLLVAIGEYIIFTAFLSKESIESTILKRLVSIMYAVLAILLVSAWWGSKNMHVGFPMTTFGMLCLCGAIYLWRYRNNRTSPLPLLIFLVTSMLDSLTGIFLPWGLNWPRIVLLSTSVFLILLTLVLFRKAIVVEMRKRFSVR